MSVIGTSLGLLGLSAVGIGVGIGVWQHRRYLKARREIVPLRRP